MASKSSNITYSMSGCGFNTERWLYLDRIVLPSYLSQGICPKLFVDWKPSSCWLAAKRAWLELSNANTQYVCALQDDFVLHPGAKEKIQKLILNHPNSPVTFFQPAVLDNNISNLPSRMGKDFIIPSGELAWGGCLILPRNIVQRVIRIADQITCFKNDDNKIQGALDGMGIQVWCGGENLVTHIGAFLPSSTSDNCGNMFIQNYRSGEFVRLHTLRQQIHQNA